MQKGVISGRVIHGDHYGKKLGFPTANLSRQGYGRTKSVFRLGIYGGTAKIRNSPKIYKAAIVVGPIDTKGLPKLEVHLLGFKGNLYGKYVTATPKKFIRVFKKYKTEQELITQIQNDIKIIKKL